MEKLVGFIISRRKYQENILIDFLTKEGILQIVARGALKSKAKLPGVIELFDLSKLELIKGKSRYILVGGRIIKRPLFLRQSLDRAFFLMAFSQVIGILVRDEQTQKVFNLFLNIMKELKDIKENRLINLFVFALAHLLLIEGLISRDEGPNFHLEKNFLEQLWYSPLNDFLDSDYNHKKLTKFIKETRNWLKSEGAKVQYLDLFLKMI